MKLLTFQAQRFAWAPFSKTLSDAEDAPEGDSVEDAIVVFMHSETKDQADGERARVFKRTLKHIKWLAGKRQFKRVVLHSFTHLGGDNSDPEFALSLMTDLAERLEQTDYDVWLTPFGYFCSWDLSVYGESLAKVWKEI